MVFPSYAGWGQVYSVSAVRGADLGTSARFDVGSRLNKLEVRLGSLEVAPGLGAWLDEVGRYWLEREDRDDGTRALLVRARDNSDGVVEDEAHRFSTCTREELVQDFVRDAHRVAPSMLAVLSTPVADWSSLHSSHSSR